MSALRTDLSGRRVLVTGGSMGIGLEVSRELARCDARVVIVARGVEAITAAGELPGDGHLGARLDVVDDHAWRDLLAALDRQGPIHGLVTAAGVLGPIGPFEDLDPNEILAAVAVNLGGTLLALHHMLPRLRASSGRAVTFAGGGATSPLPGYDAYAASKAAVARLTENLAASGSITVNCVAPGFVATRMHQQTLAAGPRAAGPAYYERTVAQLKEGGFPATEAAQLVAFLLSPESAGINGRLISAQWDPWRQEGFRARMRDDPDLGRLRRIDEQFYVRTASLRA